ncbi:hypothetical protein OCU04_007903 [Sclerotinia nivalis]|uniref:Uncharacterized protein n=1 Tax=Sclerotinia nivalis TaxID=352851 RepID=A0A9X0DHU1_9HELO|nr:hypothetical protein OCU04_007903 [Sclerotinia nivalis]
MARQIRQQLQVAPSDQPNYFLVQGDILDLDYEAIVLQLTSFMTRDKLGPNPFAWAARAGAGVVGPDGQIQAQLGLLPNPYLDDAQAMSFSGRLGTLGHGGRTPDMVIATRVDDPPELLPPPPQARIAVGRHNPDFQLRLAIQNVMNHAFDIRRGLLDNDSDSSSDDMDAEEWRLVPPNSIAFPLVGYRSGHGFINSAENIVCSIVGWFRNPALTAKFSTPAERAATIQNVVFIVPESNRAHNRRLQPRKVEDAWNRAWE